LIDPLPKSSPIAIPNAVPSLPPMTLGKMPFDEFLVNPDLVPTARPPQTPMLKAFVEGLPLKNLAPAALQTLRTSLTNSMHPVMHTALSDDPFADGCGKSNPTWNQSLSSECDVRTQLKVAPDSPAVALTPQKVLKSQGQGQLQPKSKDVEHDNGSFVKLEDMEQRMEDFINRSTYKKPPLPKALPDMADAQVWIEPDMEADDTSTSTMDFPTPLFPMEDEIEVASDGILRTGEEVDRYSRRHRGLYIVPTDLSKSSDSSRNSSPEPFPPEPIPNEELPSETIIGLSTIVAKKTTSLQEDNDSMKLACLPEDFYPVG
jgi:hypothetical protein